MEAALPHLQQGEKLPQNMDLIMARREVEKALKSLSLGSPPEKQKPSDDEAYIIWYEDSQKDPIVFTGYGAKEAAVKKFELIGQRWNATLFSKVRCNWCSCQHADRVGCDIHQVSLDNPVVEGE